MAGTSTDDLIGRLSETSKSTGDASKDFFGQSSDMLGPVADFLKKLTSNDPTAIMEATQPQRRRVIDQYAGAKKAIAEFTPRGGGQAGAMSKLLGEQAGDLADISGNARNAAFDTTGNLAMQLAQLGTGQQQLSQSALSQALAGTTQQDATRAANLQALGAGLGTVLGFLIGGPPGAAGGRALVGAAT